MQQHINLGNNPAHNYCNVSQENRDFLRYTIEKDSNYTMGDELHATAKPFTPPSLSLTPSQALKPNSKASAGKKGGNNESNGNTNSNSNANNAGTNAKGKNKSKNNNNNRRRRNGKNTNKNNSNTKGPPRTDDKGSDTNASNNAPAAETDYNAKGNNHKNNQNNGKEPRQRQRQRGNKKGGDNNSNENGDGDGNTNANVNGNGNKQPTTAKRKNNKKRSKPKKKYPWRRHIPEGTVDPITLDNLDTLEYPPFALCANVPYIPVPEWPVPIESSVKSNGKDNNNGAKSDSTTPSVIPRQQQEEDVEDLNRQRLAEIWGEHLLPSKESNAKNGANSNEKTQKASTPPPPPLSKRPLNLFDGRALAFYMVSQLQFIDPFTRRDLTRAELQNLDRYLDRYGSARTDFETNNDKDKNNKNNTRNGKKKKQKLKVTDAYDAKGITLSSAGATAATAQGRADIMQQMAQQLLNSLFVGQSSVSSIAPGEISGGGINNDGQQRQSRREQAENFSLQEQYAAMQRQEREVAAAGERRYERGFGSTPADIAAGFIQSSQDGGGFMIIDDDENPELRGRSHNNFPSLGATASAAANETTISGGIGSSPFYSASHISGRHGGPRQSTGSGAFPALQPSSVPSTANDTTNTSNMGKPAAKSKKSKTLSKMFGIVKKTTEEEKQKQWEAREAARRKAMMSNLTFGMNLVAANPSRSLLAPPTAGDSSAASGSATEEQMQRNRAFAEALGVKPATERHYSSGWARPTSGEGAGETTVSRNQELFDELDAALYSDGLIVSAREHRMDFLLKLEKRWKRFLNDDKAASLPLNRMDRTARKFVHGYAEFWNLKTESFDPEPNRYIHCVKLPNTRMPQPLLSDVARHWRGPSSISLPLPDATRTIASVMQDHTSQQTAGQISRSPLDILSRAAGVATLPTPLKLRSATAMSSSKGDLVALGEAAVQNSRSDGLIMDKERPKMKLLKRSVPLELPPFEEQLQQEAMTALALDEDLRRRQVRLEEKRRREREFELKKKQVLEDAFASDDESDGKRAAGSSDSDSEWGDDQEPLYIGSDEE